jgi:hypothetical protein
VVPKATGRAVCFALVTALRSYGIPDELLTDNGTQLTARFNAGGGEAMFDRSAGRTASPPAHQTALTHDHREGV